MIESAQAQLRRRYPTMEKFKLAITLSGGQSRLAKNIGLCRQQMTNHMRWLKNVTKDMPPTKTTNVICELRNGELDARIKELFGCRDEAVKVYRMTDGYVPGQIGTDGLEYVRTEASRTMLSVWHRDEKSKKEVLAR
ncbi:MAG TPA: hypothetical protein VFC58_09375 [Desulfosporosinus sp.]|nr:hypothetical protein [Desulfosporosinus sp.]